MASWVVESEMTSTVRPVSDHWRWLIEAHIDNDEDGTFLGTREVATGIAFTEENAWACVEKVQTSQRVAGNE